MAVALSVGCRAVAALLLASTAIAQSPSVPQGHALTASDLGAFLDGFLPLQMAQDDIAGAIIAVVKDGQVLFAKGYGYADVAKRVPVSVDGTLFRPGSISKLFTWTAVMQQVEQGKLDLDRDINSYLDFQIPPAFGKPITLRDLMTHRGGFQETTKGEEVPSSKDFVSLHDYLMHHIPSRIYPPGVTSAYSNYGATLAAYMVTRVSGESFDDYIERHIFAPLGMQHSTFRQPLPASLAPLMSKGYDLASGDPKAFELIEVAPVGGLSATALDMTRFMMAHLAHGGPLLEPETARMMYTRQPGWPDAAHAMCLGFYESSRHGHRIISHGGDTELFHSDLHLLLDDDIGIFISYNSLGRNPTVDARAILLDRFMERYFPGPPDTSYLTSTALADARAVAGLYMSTRRFETNILSPLTMLGEATLTANPSDSTLVFQDEPTLSGQRRAYREIAPMRFRAVDGDQEAFFATDASGRRVAYLDFPAIGLQAVNRPLDRKDVNYLVLAFSLGVVALSLLAWPFGAMVRAHYGQPLMLDHDTRRLRLLVRGTCLLIVAFVATFLAIGNTLSDVGAVGDLPVHLMQTLGVFCGVGALVAVYASVRSWRDSSEWIWSKVWNTALAFGCVGFSWFLIHWHILNFNLNY